MKNCLIQMLCVLLFVVFNGCTGDAEDVVLDGDALLSQESGEGLLPNPGTDSADTALGRPGSDADWTEGPGEGSALESDPCESNEDCDGDGDWVCDCAKACVPAGTLPCVEDKNCGSGNYCDTCSKMCYPIKEACEPCGGDHECAGMGSKCLSLLSGDKVCGLGCLGDVGCPEGYSCVTIENISSAQCIPDSGSCEVFGECVGDGDCAFPLICTETLVCASGCPDDASCPSGEVCDGGHCGPACDDTAHPCPSPKICDAGHCTVEGGCVDSSECLEVETYCDLELSLCVSGCQVDADCKSSGLMCDAGSCVTKGCTANFFCAFGEVCNVGKGLCETPPEPYCAECDPQSDTLCKTESESNQCVAFSDEEGTELGSFCLVGCGPDPQNPCPQGYSCEELEVEEGVKAPFCVRDCPIPPV